MSEATPQPQAATATETPAAAAAVANAPPPTIEAKSESNGPALAPPARVDSPASSTADSGTESIVTKKTVKTIHCFLCGGVQIYPGPRYENHLMNEHGVLDIDFMIELSLYKEKFGSNPSISNGIPVKTEIKLEPVVGASKGEQLLFTFRTVCVKL